MTGGLSVDDIRAARARLADVIKPTPLVRSATLDRMIGAEVFLKPENLQKTGSFKIRGAYNRVASLSAEEARRGVVAASAGNHGQALSYAATRAGVKATIVMPTTAAIAKIDATRNYGQTVVLEGVDYLQAHLAAEAIRDRTGALFVDAYDDSFVVAGQGTVGLEIGEELKPDTILVPVGGGGLIAGVALAMAAVSPETQIIGVEARGSPQFSASMAAKAPAEIGRPVETIADGLATGRIGKIPFELIRNRVRRVITVDDFEIAEAVLLLLERSKLLTEGAGAASLAGALKIREELKGQRVVILLTGGNIDINLLDRIIGHGLAKAGRLVRFSINLHDRPGELRNVLALVSKAGANVRTIEHDRTRRDIAIGSACVMLELETRGPDHIDEIRERLTSSGYDVLAEYGGRAIAHRR